MLRVELKKITDERDISKHPDMISGREIPNSIKIAESEYPINRYTCVMHAFDLTEDPTYVEIALSGSGNIFAGPEFVEFLIANNYLKQVSDQEVRVNDLVIYFDSNMIKHIGKVQAGSRIISKWGIGYLYEHKLFEVPEQYGDEYQFYTALPKEVALQRFIEYAQKKDFKCQADITNKSKMKHLAQAIVGLLLPIGTIADEHCSHNLDAWLNCNNPVVISYLSKLSKTDIGTKLGGVKLTDGTEELKGYIFLGKNTSMPEGINLYMFKSSSGNEAYLWVDESAKEFPLPKCEPEGLPLSPSALSGDMYTWKNAQPGHGIIKVACPPEEWYKPNKLSKWDAQRDRSGHWTTVINLY